jgi:predicted nucleic acid-binding protein
MKKNIACDASVLINFLRIHRIDLLERCSYSFFITNHVEKEISMSFSAQRACLDQGLRQKILQKIDIESSQERALFASLHQNDQLGAGECAAIAIANCRDYHLAIDDAQAIKKAAEWLLPSRILRTQDLIVTMIQEGVLTIDEADQLIEIWATQHRFKLKIKSFSHLT